MFLRSATAPEQLVKAEFLKIIEANVVESSRKEEIEKMGKTIAQVLIEEGKAEGIELGRKLGTVATKQEDLIELMRGKFASFPQALTEKIESMNSFTSLLLLKLAMK